MSSEIIGRKIFIGTAGWNIPAQLKESFQIFGTHLERYSRSFNCVEINTSFYREHKPETYVKWAASTPAGFRFSVKLSKYFTHTNRLREPGAKLKEVINGISHLGEKWAVLLIQLPPSLRFERDVTLQFLENLRDAYQGSIVIEPRHLSWATEPAIELFKKYKINKVLADPEPCRFPKEAQIHLEQTRYYRLHGSPEIYKSSYADGELEKIMEAANTPLMTLKPTWIIFDNTTYGFATENALKTIALSERINCAVII